MAGLFLLLFFPLSFTCFEREFVFPFIGKVGNAFSSPQEDGECMTRCSIDHCRREDKIGILPFQARSMMENDTV
jgi:hypothetical protein